MEARTLASVIQPGLKDRNDSENDNANDNDIAQTLLNQGCEYVLITGGHRNGDEVVNTLYQQKHSPENYRWKRLPGHYHGSGCTLASSIAGLFAQNQRSKAAIHQAQEYTWGSLRHAYSVGKGQSIPNRFFWAQNKTTPEE
jgi:hydroxymethylpyrimidine/phosphomethylpyrimidine kinase